MDQIKTGKFIAELRKELGLTQEQLGEKLGVTNKTVSRWENGNYMPDIETLQLLGKVFGVSINELLSGERLADREFRARADENMVALTRESAFTLWERRDFYRKKWRKDHISLFVLLGLILAVSIALPFILHRTWLIAFCPVIFLVEYAWQNNRMETYTEEKLFDGE